MHVVVVAHAVQKLLSRQSLVAQINLVVIGRAILRPSFFAKNHLVEAGPGARRVDVQLADGKRLVARVAKRLRDRRYFGQPHID